MFKHVVVGVDGGEGGSDALALARLLRSEGGELTLAYVYRGDPHVWRGSSPPFAAAEEARSHELLEQARDEAGVDANLRSHGSPTVGRGLHELAEDLGADLIVIGSSRRGIVGRVMVGDDTRAALNGAPCAVAIAPAGYSRHPVPMREIGVGYDGSPESEHALGVARRLAAEQHTRLSAFEAVVLPAAVYVAPTWPADTVIDDVVEAALARLSAIDGLEPHAAYGQPAEELAVYSASLDLLVIDDVVEAALARLSAIDGLEPHAAYGQPAEELAVYSASLDLLVIGSRSYGPIGRLVHGSTALALARNARCPLLVLTRGARAATGEHASLNGQETTGAGVSA